MPFPRGTITQVMVILADDDRCRAQSARSGATLDSSIVPGRAGPRSPRPISGRALARAFFEQRSILRIVSGPGATLEVELIAFEEVIEPPSVRKLKPILRGSPS